ncbi:MAG: 30S ribosomal protein S27ae [Candidatus Woesearchaeota archaeon]
MADEGKKKVVGPTETIHGLYEVSGNTLKRKNRSCPKCGQGTFLAAHKNRSTCGKCGYTEFKSKEEKKE